MKQIKIIREAIDRLIENASYNLSGVNYLDIEWTDDREIFTEDQFNDSVNQVTQEVNDAVNLRTYPAIEEQLDALWHSMNTGMLPKDNPFYKMIKQIKDSSPKPID